MRERAASAGLLPEAGLGWQDWQVFGELFNAHHSPRPLLSALINAQQNNWTDLVPREWSVAERNSRIHAASEYELYHVFVSAGAAGAQVPPPLNRRLRWKDIGNCCFEPRGDRKPECDLEALHDSLGVDHGFAFVTCHAHLRDQVRW